MKHQVVKMSPIQQEIWIRAMTAAVTSGKTPAVACKIADEVMAIFTEKYIKQTEVDAN